MNTRTWLARVCALTTALSLLMGPGKAQELFNVEVARAMFMPESGQNIADLLLPPPDEAPQEAPRPDLERLDDFFTELGLERLSIEDLLSRINCSLDEYSMPSQGNPSSIGSGTDGLTVAPTHIVDFDFAADPPVWDVALNMTQPVTIIVLDDFDLATIEPEEEGANSAYELTQEAFDFANTVDISADEATLEAKAKELELMLSHGAVVLNHLNALIRATGKFGLAPSGMDLNVSANLPTVTWTYGNSGPELVLVAIERGRDTLSAANALRPVLEALAGQRVVVNMSFVILPCGTLAAFEANREKFLTFEVYLEVLASAIAGSSSSVSDPSEGLLDMLAGLILDATADQPVTREALISLLGIGDEDYEAFRRDALSVLTNPIDGDTSEACSDEGDETQVQDFLLDCLRLNPQDGGFRAYVAASGNFTLDYQMFPAALPEVVGTSASMGNPMDASDPMNRKAPFSNNGEILERGAFFQLARWDGSDSSPWHYSGTSFAAPIVSFFLALDLANDVTNPPMNCLDEFLGINPPSNEVLEDFVTITFPNCFQ